MGLSLEYFKEIPGIELRQMTDKELKIVLQNLAMHTNARLSQLKKAGLTDISKSAYNLTKNYPQGLSSKEAKRGDLLKQIKAGQRYLKGATSTVSGTKKMMRNMLNTAGIKEGKNGKNMKDAFTSLFGPDFWEVYHKLLEENKAYKEYSDPLIQTIADVYEKKKDEETKEEYITNMLNEARKRFKDKYGAGINFASDEDLAEKYKRRR